MNVVFLFEGTYNSPNKNPSAISELYYHYEVDHFLHRRILPGEMLGSGILRRLVNDPNKGQVVRLISGTGTNGCCVRKWWNGITGGDWDCIVKTQYKRLLRIVQKLGNGKPSEIQLYVFGFSRGAFQAKLFVNGISYFGLSKTPDEFVAAIKSANKSELRINSDIPQIRFVGLLDTVSHTMIGKPLGWEDVGIPPSVGHCRHAVAIHEYRKRFTPQILNANGIASNVEERWFIGSHSDLGWAYNGVRSKRNNHAYTQACGKMALTWLLEPVKGKLIGDLSEFEELNHTAKDFLGLLRYFMFVIHRSFEDVSNAFGSVGVRNSGASPKFHHSVEGIIALQSLSGLDRMMIPVRRYAWCVLRNRRCYISFRDLISQMECLDGRIAIGPTFESRQEIEKILNALKIDGVNRLYEAYLELKRKGIIQHSWLEELCAGLSGCSAVL